MKAFQSSLFKKISNSFHRHKTTREIERKHSGINVPEMVSSLIQ